MIKKIALTLFLCADAQAVMVQTPRGSYEVVQTPGGFQVYGMSGQGTTTVIRQGNGYSVIAPDGVTNVYGDGTTSKPDMTVDPFDLSVTPIPNLGD